MKNKLSHALMLFIFLLVVACAYSIITGIMESRWEKELNEYVAQEYDNSSVIIDEITFKDGDSYISFTVSETDAQYSCKMIAEKVSGKWEKKYVYFGINQESKYSTDYWGL